MGFKDLLKEKLKDNIGSKVNLDKLPSGFQRVGDIIVLNLDEEFDSVKKEIGEAVLELFGVRSVCNKFGIITGKFREPQIEVIAGDNNTVVTHIEHGCKYRFDIRKVMFAKGNVSERIRIAKQVKPGEIIVDMFAGLGYFTIPIGKLSDAEKVYSIELNPVSFEFLQENININHIHGVIAINGDCKEEVNKLVSEGVKADRVLLGYLPPPKEFLPWAFKIVKKNGIIHYEDLVKVNNKESDIDRIVLEIRDVAKDFGFDVSLIEAKKVKAYGPMIDHYVFDIKIL